MLDVGYANALPAYLEALVAAAPGEVVGVDPIEAPVDGVRSVVGDLRALPFADGSFDVAFCISTIEHVGRDNRVYGVDEERDDTGIPSGLRELRRVARRILLTVPTGVEEDHGWFVQLPVSDVARAVRRRRRSRSPRTRCTSSAPTAGRPRTARRRTRATARAEPPPRRCTASSYAPSRSRASLRRRAARTPNTAAAASSAIGPSDDHRVEQPRELEQEEGAGVAHGPLESPRLVRHDGGRLRDDEAHRDRRQRSLAHGAGARLRLRRERGLRLAELVLEAEPLGRRERAVRELALSSAIVVWSAAICRWRTFASAGDPGSARAAP